MMGPMPPPTVIFDFDGTLTSSTEIALEIANALSSEFGYPPIRPEEVPALRALGARALLSRLNIPLQRVPALVRRVREEHALRIARAEPTPGMPEAIRELRGGGCATLIMSSNTTSTILAFLRRHNLEAEFDFVYASSGLFGKRAGLKKLLRERALSPQEVVYVGDETRDRDACRAAGIPFLGVAWGLNTAEVLREGSSAPVIRSPGELPVAVLSRRAL